MKDSTILVLVACVAIVAIYSLTLVFVFSKADTKINAKYKKEDSELCVTLDKKEKDS